MAQAGKSNIGRCVAISESLQYLLDLILTVLTGSTQYIYIYISNDLQIF
jgi:hypothetical protein